MRMSSRKCQVPVQRGIPGCSPECVGSYHLSLRAQRGGAWGPIQSGAPLWEQSNHVHSRRGGVSGALPGLCLWRQPQCFLCVHFSVAIAESERSGWLCRGLCPAATCRYWKICVWDGRTRQKPGTGECVGHVFWGGRRAVGTHWKWLWRTQASLQSAAMSVDPSPRWYNLVFSPLQPQCWAGLLWQPGARASRRILRGVFGTARALSGQLWAPSAASSPVGAVRTGGSSGEESRFVWGTRAWEELGGSWSSQSSLLLKHWRVY